MTESVLPFVIPLGVAAALPDTYHANSYLAVVGKAGYWLVDCADGPIPRLGRVGLDPLNVQGVILTHFHPDHVYGLPAFLVGLFLLAMERGYAWPSPLPIYARPEVLSRAEGLVGLFSGQEWLSRVPLDFRAVTSEVGAPVAETTDFVIDAAPTEHSTPSLAVRFVARSNGRAFVYSSDTLPCAAVETLARGASLLIHEATDSDLGHSRPGAVGLLAGRAGVKNLVLIHYRGTLPAMTHALAEAGRTFSGPVELAQEFRPYLW
ncbi:MAG: ribonuclease Z [Anaerolineae bacterium]|nr:ribonuclease Z [Anaerolineae bacterium]